MKKKQLWAFLLASILTLGCMAAPMSAVHTPDDDTFILRVSGRIDQSIPAKSTVTTAEGFYLAAGDTISYNCTYTPKSASVDFGFIAPNGLFYSIKCTSGSVNESIEVNQTGQYTLAIRNNASYTVTVTGTVKY
ncbi:hypothetical protein [Pseudoflavonifractor sp. AF19-9AC]|uniref:hypothetical protein n=1 Tax=Pseudoflavonifractor sp. AF19-9AC TaxID=2292244 RepID=UPI0011C48318|nr:hypothetical protein [Pseudoflavonifractor sp. AF19-9AC]